MVEELIRQGKSLEDAREGGTSGCVEAGAFGKEAYILTGYFNLPKLLELALHDGVDPRTGQQLGPSTGDPRSFQSFDDLFAAWQQQVDHFVDIKHRGNQIIERLYATRAQAPFLSLIIDDCIATGRDYNDGGARYNTSYIQGVGIGSLTDSLSALKHQVFEGDLSMAEMVEALHTDFEDREPLRLRLANKTPRYGNDDDRADDLMVRCFETFFDAVDGRPNTRGGSYHIDMLPTTCHVYFGSVIGALPDGRPAGAPLSEGISPVQGADRQGPTAVFKSAAKMDHLRTGGTLLNMKFTPQLLGRRDRDQNARVVGSRLFRNGHAPRPVQRGPRGDPPRGPGRPRQPPRSHRPRGRLLGLLLRHLPRAPGRDHRTHRARHRPINHPPGSRDGRPTNRMSPGPIVGHASRVPRGWAEFKIQN